MVQDQSFRPDKELADQFYHLTDFKSDKRCIAASNIIMQIEHSKKKDVVVKYCIERLVRGLSSGRQAARVGFTVALNAIMKKLGPSVVPIIIRELKSASNNRDSNEPLANSAFGQVLPCLTIVQCLKQEEITVDLIDQLLDLTLKIFEASPFFGHLCVQVILSLSSKIDKKLFKSHVWPHIKEICRVSTEQCSANNLWLILGLKEVFPDHIDKKCPEYVSSQEMSGDTLKHFIRLIIMTSDNFPVVHPGIICLFKSMLQNVPMLKIFYKSFVEKILNHERKAVVIYGYQTLEKIFPFIGTEAQVSILFSKNIFEHLLKCLMEKLPCSRVCRPYFIQFLTNLCQSVIDKKDGSILADVIRTVSSVSTNFDDLIGRRFLLALINELINLESKTENDKVIWEILDMLFDSLSDLSTKIQQKLNAVVMSSIIEKSKLLTSICLMAKNNLEVKRKILRRFVEVLSKLDDDSTEILPVKSVLEGKYFDCIESCYSVQNGPRLLNLTFSKEHCSLIAEILDTLYESRKDKFKNEETCKLIKKVKKTLSKMENYESTGAERGFYVLMQYFAMGTIVNFSDFGSILEEILACYKEYSTKNETENSSKDTWLDVLIDLVLSILSKENRHLRFPIEVAMSNMASLFKKRHLEPIFKVLNVSHTDEVMEDDGDVSESEENGVDEEKGENEKESEDEESEKEDDDDDDENEDKSEVNKALEDAIQNALKDADALETESVKSDVSDDTMLKLDEKLADVFKLHAKSGKVKNRIEQTTLSFRMRCFEMLLIFVHSIDDTTVLMDMVLPLLEIIQQASKFGHQHSSIVKRANFVMNAVCIKKLNLDRKCGRTGDEICSFIDGIFKLSNGTADIYVQSTCFEALKFILRIGAKLFDNNQTYVEALKKVVDENLELFITEKTCLTPANHFNYIFEKYPDVFLSHVINIAGKLSDNNLRIFRSTELSTFCQLILSKVNLSTIKEDKSKLKTVRKFMKIFIPFLFEILDKLRQILTDKPKSPLKSTFLLAILNVAKCLQRFHDAQIMKFDCESDDHHSIGCKFDKQQVDHYRDVMQTLAQYKMYRTKGKSTQNHSVLCTLLKKNLVVKPQRFFADLGKLFFTNFKTGDQEEESDNDDQETPMKKKKMES